MLMTLAVRPKGLTAVFFALLRPNPQRHQTEAPENRALDDLSGKLFVTSAPQLSTPAHVHYW
jgi:hypothetical protein